MPHEFEVRAEIAVDATPEQVWEAITTGPGINSWFMGRNEVEPREGGTVRMSLPGWTMESTVTAWQPSERLAFQGNENPDGSLHAFEYLVEGRGGGSTVVRLVHSGFLGDNWQEEYDALSKGDGMYLRKLALYLKHFPGRTSTYAMFAPGPQLPDRDQAWGAFMDVLGLSGTVTEGEPVRLTVAGLTPVDGVVEFASQPTYIGVRTPDGMYTFIHGYQDTVVVEHHNFSDGVHGNAIEQAWQSWLDRLAA